MASLIYQPIKKYINENNNPSWPYKNNNAIYNVINYILNTPNEIVYADALGLRLASVDEMAWTFEYIQTLYNKTTGCRIRHEVLIFDDPTEYIDLNGYSKLSELAYGMAEYYYRSGFQTVFSVWPYDKDLRRKLPEIHFAVSTVSVCDGHKYHTNRYIRAEQEVYFNDVIAFLTGKTVNVPVIGEDEPDYSDMLYYPRIKDLAL